MDMTFIELIDEICLRPDAYVGEKSLIRVASFIGGWLCGRGSAAQSDRKLLREFQTWIAVRHNVNGTNGWEAIIRFHCASSEAHGVDCLHRLFHEFLEVRGTVKESVKDA